MSEPFIGEIRIFANQYVPDGWILCNGKPLPITQYTALYAVIGTTYGGDGYSYFKPPDLSGVAPVHQGKGKGLTEKPIGASGGTIAVSLQPKHIPSHNHKVNATKAKATSSDPSGRIWSKVSGIGLYATTNTNLVEMKDTSLGESGSESPEGHDNVQPCLGMYFAMAYEGMFPVRK